MTTLTEALADWDRLDELGAPAVPRIPTRCSICGKPIARKWAAITGRCQDCHGRREPWRKGLERIWSLTIYLPGVDEFASTQIIHSSKKDLGLTRAMMALAAAYSPYSDNSAQWAPTVIIPCPSHKGRESPRSAALGAGVSDIFGIPSHDVLRRIDDNPPRSAVKGKDHPADVSEMIGQMEIECAAEFTGEEKILLVDDIVTHGVTLGNCGLIMMERGAKSIRAITFARTRSLEALIYNYEQDILEGEE